MPRLTANENVVQPSTSEKYELKDWKLTTQVRPAACLQAVLAVQDWKPSRRSAGQTSRRISRVTILLSMNFDNVKTHCLKKAPVVDTAIPESAPPAGHQWLFDL